MSDKERPAKEYFKGMYGNPIYGVIFKDMDNKMLEASASDLWDLMEGFYKHQMSKELEGFEFLTEDDVKKSEMERTFYFQKNMLNMTIEKKLLNHLKKKIG